MNSGNKAFIFDMDGVLINSEPVWEQYEKKFLSELIGKNNFSKMEDEILGNTANKIYEILCVYGLKLSKQEFFRLYDGYAKRVYAESSLTESIETLIDKLTGMDFKLGLVSASRQNWIDLVLARFNMRNRYQYVLSLNDTENMRAKPFPDGYIKAMEILQAAPEKTIILEDSNKGIEAAKKSGAFTICLKENLPAGYKPAGADLYVNTIAQLISLSGGVFNL
jgi:beta-phosphoglucomutase-like phosphatase (HAD superfamily)